MQCGCYASNTALLLGMLIGAKRNNPGFTGFKVLEFGSVLDGFNSTCQMTPACDEGNDSNFEWNNPAASPSTTGLRVKSRDDSTEGLKAQILLDAIVLRFGTRALSSR